MSDAKARRPDARAARPAGSVRKAILRLAHRTRGHRQPRPARRRRVGERARTKTGRSGTGSLTTPAPLPWGVWMKWECLDQIMTNEADTGMNTDNRVIVGLRPSRPTCSGSGSAIGSFARPNARRGVARRISTAVEAIGGRSWQTTRHGCSVKWAAWLAWPLAWVRMSVSPGSGILTRSRRMRGGNFQPTQKLPPRRHAKREPRLGARGGDGERALVRASNFGCYVQSKPQPLLHLTNLTAKKWLKKPLHCLGRNGFAGIGDPDLEGFP